MLTRYLTLNTILFCIIFAMTLFIGNMVTTFTKLALANPLMNVRAIVIEPVYTDQELLQFTGTFDREVACTLIDFRLDLTNMVTNDVISLNKTHLATAPMPNKGPGYDMEIEFALLMPNTIYPGRWQPTFNGEYICNKGIFTAQKSVHLVTPSFSIMASH
jgi:hypothetical protein